MFSQLEKAFIRVHGPQAITNLRSLVNNVSVLTIGGDQLTGKSTLCKDVASKLNVPCVSAGSVFRDLAKKQGISVAQLSKQAYEDPSIDISIEYATCETILRGVVTADKPAVIIEGRNPSVMAKFCRDVIQKDPQYFVSVYLSCSPRIQARRYIGREVELGLSHAINDLISKEKTFKTLHEVAEEINALSSHPDITTAINSGKINLQDVLKAFVENESRDDLDRARYMEFYGFPPELDYRHHSLYDLIIDTSNHNPIDSMKEVMEFLETHPSGKLFLEASTRKQSCISM